MGGDLQGVRAKIARAKVNLELLDSEQSTWFETKPYTIHPEINRDFPPEVNILFVVTAAQPVPRKFSAIIGDILYDLRSALDHLACQLVVANGGNINRGIGGTNFPIFKDRLKPNGRPRTIAISGGVDLAARAAIERFQPYNRINDSEHDPLWLLSELCNADKHRLLLLVGLAYDTISLTLDGKTYQFPNEPIPLIVGRSISTLALGIGEDPEAVPVSVIPFPLIAFAEEEELCGGRPVSELLTTLKSHVESVVSDLAIFVRQS